MIEINSRLHRDPLVLALGLAPLGVWVRLMCAWSGGLCPAGRIPDATLRQIANPRETAALEEAALLERADGASWQVALGFPGQPPLFRVCRTPRGRAPVSPGDRGLS